ncbi:LOW QUALITY PROTEIN: thiosulfate sulfurtransferase/rhodanese-like domain-containing protein 2 [Trematomus bernacchii]|uniref:LOW QUALITY PROTEIN: thiosulfate sulfurtransferase/rhodanese-like domain-containing protein 2 n=1 Tax=Trematomus bernacchii TaxID=40690 RepID=UPI00146BF408|nr:LOW QUALITY PROTEIN: thiosulfate sulfurtransferase/rhodanese-like domain-containing protein 2 [Trematomus bernacchii]
MAEDNTSFSEFMDLDLDTRTCNGVRQEKQLSASQRRCYSLCRRKSFAGFVASKRNSSQEEGDSSWCCCGQTFREHSAIHKHVARTHDPEIQRLTQDAYQCLLNQLEEEAETQQLNECEAEPVDISAWIPDTRHISEEQLQKGPGKVLLYYRYCQIEDPHVICAWQRALCEKLHLTGKVRVATEGINGTVGGTNMATDAYIDATRSHPLFKMEKDDFKTSDGGAECFKDLRVGVYKEIVPMGMEPDVVSYQPGGVHLEPEEVHKEVEALLAKRTRAMTPILLDCRNFMRVKIGQFTQCLAPSIRKFSYFPDYVDQNLDLFRNKRVLMYCTGGIRCERGSAYLRSKDVCKEVYQLKGGIHRYLEQVPEGFYRGKLFVFDERYAISSNKDIISECRYCGSPWDRYQLCSTRFCCQLVLSCPGCRQDGRTACCPACQTKGQNQSQASGPHHKEECECTEGRPRIPQDA